MTFDMRSLLGISFFYSMFQQLVGAESARDRFTQLHIRPHPGLSILDIGCGTAEILDSLPDVDYFGFDASPVYIEAARHKYSGRATFAVGSIANPPMTTQRYDLVLAMGVVHHVADAAATALFQLARDHLKSGGRVVTIDPVITPDQARLARFVVNKDRGKHVRTLREYESLTQAVFPAGLLTVHHDLLRIPYSHVVLHADV